MILPNLWLTMNEEDINHQEAWEKSRPERDWIPLGRSDRTGAVEGCPGACILSMEGQIRKTESWEPPYVFSLIPETPSPSHLSYFWRSEGSNPRMISRIEYRTPPCGSQELLEPGWNAKTYRSKRRVIHQVMTEVSSVLNRYYPTDLSEWR